MKIFRQDRSTMFTGVVCIGTNTLVGISTSMTLKTFDMIVHSPASAAGTPEPVTLRLVGGASQLC
jgi:hypothetical protein